MLQRLLIIVILPIMVAACASPARVNEMAPTATAPVDAGSPLASAVCVTSVTGGEETNPLWTSEVDNSAFRSAIEKALSNNGMAARSASGCTYEIEANLLGLAQPIAGFNLEVTANVNYSLLDQVSRNPYFQTTVVTPYTAEFSASFLANERLRIANEGAIRTNITEFLDQLISHARSDPPATAPSAPSS